MLSSYDHINKKLSGIAFLLLLFYSPVSLSQVNILDSEFTFRAGLVKTGSALDMISRQTGYHFTFDSRLIDTEKKTITIAAPWNYGREFVVLHELAHLVWKDFVSSDKKKEWFKLVKNTPDKPEDGMQELFCMSYAATYAKRPPSQFDIEKWKQFIQKLSQ